MNRARNKFYKPGLLLLAALLLFAVSRVQNALNRQREDPRLGISRGVGLGSNAPPVLAFTTVALGGFRGLIANALWIRASDLQEEGKYFEMVQLADWITKLEPSFVQVWLVQAWNMAYNISVKFTDPADRWRWVQRGIELLRDDGLRFNPREALIYRELAWFFQHKMGQNMDDAHVYYKMKWAEQMEAVLGQGRPDFEDLIHPRTPAAQQRAEILRGKYKLNPKIMQEVDREYGPLEWRLPEAHAIYWAVVGLERSKTNDLITLRRVIYQSMHQAVRHGRLIQVNTNIPPVIAPDLDLVSKANQAYEQMIREETEKREAIRTAHRNFLLEVTYLLYTHGRMAEAGRYFKLMNEKYPGHLPPNLTLDQFALRHLAGSIRSLSHDQAQTVIEGLLRQSFISRALGEDEKAEGMDLMARKLWQSYQSNIGDQQERIGLPKFEQLQKIVLDELLDPQQGLRPELAARLRTALNL